MIRPACASDLPLLPAIEEAAGQLFAGTAMALVLDVPPTPVLPEAVLLPPPALRVATEGWGAPVEFLLAERTEARMVLEAEAGFDPGRRVAMARRP